jgi:hypothetical protein
VALITSINRRVVCLAGTGVAAAVAVVMTVGAVLVLQLNLCGQQW